MHSSARSGECMPYTKTMKVKAAWNDPSKGQIKPIWRLITAGRAQEGLRSAWRK